jgi:hypothetical protein
MNPDYKKYTLIELYDVKENINMELYPERYKLLLCEIKLREQNPEGESAPEKLSEKDKVSITKVIMAMGFLFMEFNSCF